MLIVTILVLTHLLCNHCHTETISEAHMDTEDQHNIEVGLEDKLITDISKRHSLLVRPNSCKQTPCAGALLLQVSYNIIQISAFSHTDETLNISGWFTLIWKDKRLSWNKSNYGNLTSVLLPATRIWLPDVGVMNSKSNKYFDFSNEDTSRVNLEYDGTVTWMAGVILNIACPLDVSLFPFDTQRCHIIFMPWQSTMDHLNIQPNQQGGAVDNSYLPNSNISEWDIDAVTFELKQCCIDLDLSYHYQYIQICIQLTRQPLYFIVLVIVPYVMISVLACLIYTLADTGDRLRLSLLLAFCMTMYFIIVATNAPRSMKTLPVLGIYLIIQMALLGIATAMAVVNNKLRFFQPPPGTENSPRQIMKPLRGKLFEKSTKITQPFSDSVPCIKRARKLIQSFNIDSLKLQNTQMQDPPFSLDERFHSVAKNGAGKETFPLVDQQEAYCSTTFSNTTNHANECGLTPYSWLSLEPRDIFAENNFNEQVKFNLNSHCSRRISWPSFSKGTSVRRRIHEKFSSKSFHLTKVFSSSVFDPTFPWSAMGPYKSLAGLLDTLGMVLYIILSALNALVCLILIPRLSKRSGNKC